MQLTLDFRPGLTQQHRTLRDCVRTVVYQHSGGVGGVAPALDMSPSELGRRLNHEDGDAHRNLDIDDFVDLIAATGDHRPIYWLVERFLPNEEQKRQAAVDQLTHLMPQIAALLEVVSPPDKARRR